MPTQSTDPLSPDSPYAIVGRELQVYCCNDVQWRALHTATRIKHPQAFFLKRRNPRNPFYLKWDGFQRIIDRDWNGAGVYGVPLGLYQRVVDAESQYLEGLAEFIWGNIRRPHPAPFQQLLCDKVLSPPQQQVCEILLTNWLASVQFKTGSGKTEVMMNACACEFDFNPDQRFVVLVPVKTLLHQTCKRFKDELQGRVKVGIAGDGKLDTDAHVIIATPHTVVNSDAVELHEYLASCTHVIVDEGHHGGSELWGKAIDKCPTACLWGLSGKMSYERAPNKQKEHAIEARFGPMLIESEAPERRCEVQLHTYTTKGWTPTRTNLPAQIRDGVKAAFKYAGVPGWVYGVYHGLDETGKPSRMCMTTDSKGNLKPDRTKYGVYALREGRMALVKPAEMEQNSLVYQTAHDIGIMEHAQRNQWAAGLAQQLTAKGEPWIMTVVKLRHVVKLATLLTELGVSFGVVSGDQSSGANQDALNAFRAGKVSGLVAIYQSVSEGVDVPGLIHLIKLDGQSGEQVLTQQDGRVARAFEGKQAGLVHLPLDPHNASLQKTANRIKKYMKDSLSVKVVPHSL